MTILNTALWPWQQQDWEHLQAYITQQRIPQALLISGKPGLGKRHLAKQFAFTLLCAAPKQTGFACGHCASCLLLHAENHPDFFTISPEETGKTITVDSLRSLMTRLALKPQFERYRTVIIEPADAMNNNAANAFLKCLEEPTERTVLILVAENPRRLPATIISRCQKLSPAAPDKLILINWLQQQKPDLDHTNAAILADMAQNAPLLALSYANDETVSLRNQCFIDWLAIAEHRKDPISVAENWQKLPGHQLLFWLTSWLIDLIKHALLVNTDHLLNPDLNKPLQALAQRLELLEVYRLYDLLLASRQRLDTTINRQCLFEEILLHWYQLNQRK